MTVKSSLSAMSVQDLVVRFEQIALEQHDAILSFQNARYNRLYRSMTDICDELKARGGDQRRALLPLYHHPNPTVRFKAAITTLALSPLEARKVLQMIKDRDEFPVAMDASQVLNAFDEGRYIPT